MKFLKPRLITFLLSIAAGAAIALGGILFLLSSAFIPSDFVIDKKLIGALLFPVGLILVCYLRLNLYTGKIGMAFRNKKLDKKGLPTWEWLITILLGNAVGAFLIGTIIYLICLPLDGTAFKAAVIAAGASRDMAFEFQPIFDMSYKSIFCGMLVYIAIFFFNRLDNQFGKIVGIIVPIAFFVYAGFQHCVANMFYMAASGCWTWNYLVGLLITIVGNSLGALLLDLFVKYK